MSEDTFTASDFAPADTGGGGTPTSTPEPVASSPDPVETTALLGEATTQPAVGQTVPPPSTEPAKPTGPIPFDVHKTALENARTKAVDEYRQQHGWAEQVSPQEFQQVQEIARHFSGRNPIEGLQSLIAEIRKDPQMEAELRSWQGRALSQLRQPQQAQPPAEPQMVNVQLEDGSIVPLPRDPQAYAAQIRQQTLNELRQEFQPVTQTIQQLQAERAYAQQQQQVEHFVTTTFADVQTWPGMESADSRAAVAKELAASRIDAHDPREVSLALNAAYRKVVLPTLQTSSRQAVLNDINRQAAASTVNPAHTSTRAPKSYDEMSIAEALQFEASRQG